MRENGVVTSPKNSLTLPLQCHPATPPGVPLVLSVAVSVINIGLQLVYTVCADCAALRIPTATAPGPADGLWLHTCLEAFVAIEGDEAYREFNFSPSGQWAIYNFASERLKASNDVDAPMPLAIQLHASTEQVTLTTHLPWGALPLRGSVVCVGLSAVIEEANGHLSYWALQHPCAQPDFHHPAGRALRLALPNP